MQLLTILTLWFVTGTVLAFSLPPVHKTDLDNMKTKFPPIHSDAEYLAKHPQPQP